REVGVRRACQRASPRRASRSSAVPTAPRSAITRSALRGAPTLPLRFRPRAPMTRTFAACSTRGSDLRLRLLFAAALFFASLFAPAVARAEDACSGAATKHVYAPSADTLLALAICHEAHDKTASAWAEYEEAATLARRAKNAALAKVA